jgi:hypothetical protein
MALPSIIVDLRDRAGMFVAPATYDTITAYLLGHDRALQGGLLVGFREWLIVQLNDGNNLAWPGLVNALRDRAEPQSDDDAARAFLFRLLEEFFAERQRQAGLRRVFFRYERWLERQPWYGPTSPQWIFPGDNGDGEQQH